MFEEQKYCVMCLSEWENYDKISVYVPVRDTVDVSFTWPASQDFLFDLSYDLMIIQEHQLQLQ